MQIAESVTADLTGPVCEHMTERVVAAHVNWSIAQAADKMTEHNLRRIVIVDDQKQVVGVVSQRDVLRHYLATHHSAAEDSPSAPTKIDSLIHAEKPITVSPETPLLKAAVVLATNRIGCLPVVGPRQELVGMLTAGNLLRHVTGFAKDSLESGFHFFSPEAEARGKTPAYIRRVNGDLVIPLDFLDEDHATQFAQLGYDPPGGRILVKFVEESNGKDGAVPTRRDKEYIIIAASGFVAHFHLAGKASAFDVSRHSDNRYLILTPRQGI